MRGHSSQDEIARCKLHGTAVRSHGFACWHSLPVGKNIQYRRTSAPHMPRVRFYVHLKQQSYAPGVLSEAVEILMNLN
jgi:hypothetical protein